MPPRAIYEHSGPAELVLEGENLTPDTLKLYHNGVLYTPLESSDTYAYYLLGDNGTNKVMLNGKNYCTINIKDIVVPEGLPTTLSGYQKNNDTTSRGAGTFINSQAATDANCINYAFAVNESFPFFMFYLRVPSEDSSIFEFVNCTLNNYASADGESRVNVSVIDATRPAYITYQGFIIAVFNYSA